MLVMFQRHFGVLQSEEHSDLMMKVKRVCPIEQNPSCFSYYISIDIDLEYNPNLTPDGSLNAERIKTDLCQHLQDAWFTNSFLQEVRCENGALVVDTAPPAGVVRICITLVACLTTSIQNTKIL